MRYGKSLLGMAALFALAACKDDGVSPPVDQGPMAIVRFVNAVPDTGTVDFAFMDKVENLPQLKGVAFRAASGMYTQVAAGTRPVRIFPFSTNEALTKVRLVDTNVTLDADKRYTLVYAGRARAGAPAAEAAKLVVMEDLRTLPTPGADQIAIQALHVAVGYGNLDVYVVPVDSTTVGNPANWQTQNAGVVRNVSYLSKAAYLNVPARKPAVKGNLYRFVVTAAGETTPLFAATANQPGVAATAGQGYGAQPGVQIAGSVLTAIIASGSTPGSRESAAANQTPTVVLAIDKVLNP